MIVVQHEANFCFIDAHAEGIGRDHDVEFALHELFLDLMPFRRREATVIGLRGDITIAQQAGQPANDSAFRGCCRLAVLGQQRP